MCAVGFPARCRARQWRATRFRKRFQLTTESSRQRQAGKITGLAANPRVAAFAKRLGAGLPITVGPRGCARLQRPIFASQFVAVQGAARCRHGIHPVFEKALVNIVVLIHFSASWQIEAAFFLNACVRIVDSNNFKMNGLDALHRSSRR